jgi:hypothetical protein
MESINTLKQFYDLMFETKNARSRVVRSRLDGTSASSEDVEILSAALEKLRAVPGSGGRHRLGLGGGKSIDLDLSYEIGELEKDQFFLSHTEDDFNRRMEKIHPGFADHMEEGSRFLAGRRFRSFITDRDGTVNNYCGRYLSSIQ